MDSPRTFMCFGSALLSCVCVFSPCAVDSIEMFLNATQETVTQFVFNTSAFIAENERIISEIDDIIASLADIHSRVNRVRERTARVTPYSLCYHPITDIIQ